MWPDRVSNPGPPTYESGVLPIALRGPAKTYYKKRQLHPKAGRGERLVGGCFGFNGPLRQYFSLYRAVSQREGDRREKG